MTAGKGHSLRMKSDWNRIFRSMAQCGYIYLHDEINSMDDEWYCQDETENGIEAPGLPRHGQAGRRPM